MFSEMNSNVNGFILTATYTTSHNNYLQDTNEILVNCYSHSSWDEFQNTSNIRFNVMSLMEMNTAPHKGFILEHQIFNRIWKHDQNACWFKTTPVHKKRPFGWGEFPRPMGFILFASTSSTNIQFITEMNIPRPKGVHSRSSFGITGHECSNHNNNSNLELMKAKRPFGQWHPVIHLLMLSNFPRWTLRVQWGFILVRSNGQRNETPEVRQFSINAVAEMNIPRPMGVHSHASREIQRRVQLDKSSRSECWMQSRINIEKAFPD